MHLMQSRFIFIRTACPVLVSSLLLLAGCAKYDADALFPEAMTAAASAHWDEAHGICEKALRSKPSHLPSRILKGLCQHHLEQSRKAEETLRGAAQDAPQDFCAQYFHGWILCEAGQYQDALPPLRQARKLRPDHPETLALLARCSLEQSLPEGIDHLGRLRRNPTYGKGAAIDNSIALLHLSQGDMTRARNHLLAGLRRDPDNPVVAQNLGVLHDQYISQPREALRYYGMALANSQKTGDTARAARIRRRLQDLARERRLGGE